MSEEIVEQTETQAMDSLMAGYNKRGEEPPAEVPVPQKEAIEEPVAHSPAAESDQTEQVAAEPTEAEKLAADLADLKAKVATIQSGSDSDSVRKLHGQIGNINRTLKQLQKEAPADDELAAAITAAEALATEFTDMAPIVTALKAVVKRTAAQVAEPPANDEPASTLDARQLAAIEALDEEHPDRLNVIKSQEFKDWLAAKPTEFQEKVMNSWNPVVVAKGLTEFKDAQKARQKKQERLAAAVAPQGTPVQASPSTLNDEQGLWVGYNKGRKRLQA